MSNKYLNEKVISDKLEEEEKKKESVKKEEQNNTESKPDNFDKSLEEVIYDVKNIGRELSQNIDIDAPESLGLEKIDVPTKTDDELESLAKSSLDKKYGTKKDNTNNSFEKEIEKIFSSKEELKNNASKKQEEISSIYNKSIKETEEQMLRRGLARSSIVIGELSSLEAGKANELASILNNLEENLTKAEENIANLEKEKEEALSSLDIEYALDLEKELEKVKSDYNKTRNEAISFNNNIEKLEAEYKLKLDKQKLEKQKELNELKQNGGIDYKGVEIREKQFEYLKNYFSSLEPEYAFNLFLTNKELQPILLDRYTEMYSYLKSRC